MYELQFAFQSRGEKQTILINTFYVYTKWI